MKDEAHHNFPHYFAEYDEYFREYRGNYPADIRRVRDDIS